ncbi:MAG: 1-acyl-sn-glycerol-3-phosphate acyltransferase [Hoeflea sp.]|uniref:1-acyl-sn-glycerol-3-phosphate acyltransferase n=1 Tax=Hoeflea sp. TaxID=1940281 RepID=UPI001DF9FCD6|nr:1-acyl-sn-glycerol-3-phosphate acyltransferase [Hoeflea sp.]MBU4529878.1 1-acyl-sn-glycerol-3-phosphate acyltransferase [Alphaproteobacteria bacterium]MBU4547101.1 1-acyl-sn-glycerol-3-phosphate acyltransferase [Alphaproteobacteria bacterium]MBU4548714.1 1-acyl-sn-glycerol-3-phosphate acyltransferase [Alphaproteobacteria bacterium]MBV1722371.1 1-acyl-sn-glycerol-3-phosphate acyltransferase [Hoeflea sp.]MBV1762473.1 1-acyl-sn-glycerol-3-phosphate acyltransferase [Hoeflea sp.]
MAYVAEISDRLHVLAHGRPGHIIDRLIAERGGRLVDHPAWPMIRPVVYATLKYGAAVRMADDIAAMSGHEAFQYISKILKLDIQSRGAERIPRKGGFLLVANHPTGMADGVAMFDFLAQSRPDMMFFANRDAVRISQRFDEIIIPVEWREEFKSRDKTRQTLQLTNRAVQDGKATVLFPSGRIAFWNEGRLTERPWKASAITLARRHDLPVVPVNISARNSGLFYWLSKHSTELRDMTVFHELLNKKHHTFRFTVGQPILPEALDGDPAEAVKALEYHTVHGLAANPDRAFEPAPKGWSQAA